MAESALRQLFGKPEQQTQESPYIDLLRQNKSKDFVNRILNPGTSPAPVQFDENNIATHQMAAEVDENGNWYVFPTIVNQGGKLVSMPLYDAFDYARKTGEYIPMPNMESAINLSENYKTKAMQDFYSRPVQRPQAQAQPSNPSALRQFTPQSAEPAVRSYNPFNPAFRETMRSGITDLLGGRAMGGTPTQRYRAGMADLLTGAVDFVPGVGEAVGVTDTVQAARGGNYGTAAILGGATALGMVPVVGDAASKAIRGIPAISTGSKINLDPSSLAFREADQNRLEQVGELFDSGEEINPIVTIYNNGKRDILDGHNRAAAAISRQQNLPAVDIDIKEYERLKEAGFDDMEITYATLLRANEDDAASAINNQFYGAGIRQRGTEALSLMDDPAAVVPAPSPLEGTLDMSTAARMQRAVEQVYTPDLYHGTAADVSEFNPLQFGGSVTKARSAKLGTWLVDNPTVAGGYARLAAEDVPVQRLLDQSMRAERLGNFDEAERLNRLAENLELGGKLRGGGGQNIMPLRARGNFLERDAEGATMSDLDDSQLTDWAEEAKAKGFDGLKINNFSDNADYGQYIPATHYLIFDPANIRSTNAAFDPAKRGSANLMAGAAGATIGLSALRNIQRDEEPQRKPD